jgi:hypothetical protein
MTSYKIAKVPFPVEKAKEILDSYEKSKNSPGGFSVRYRMPREMVAMVNENVGAGADNTYGLGLGRAERLSLLLQPRQMEGITNAKEKSKAYNLVMSKKQIKAMMGQGLFSSIISAVAPAVVEAAVGAISKKVKGKGEETETQQEQPEDIAMEAEGRGYNIEPLEDFDVCDHCKGSGLIPLLAPLLAPLVRPGKKAPPPRPRMMAPPPPRFMPKNVPGAPRIGL